MPMPLPIKRLLREARCAAKIDPAHYSAATSQNRLESFSYAIAGCAYMLRRQKNTRIIFVATLALVACGLWLQLPPLEWSLLILAAAGVWLAEFINAAVEACVNLSTASPQPMARVAKDVAAGAVLIAVITAILVGISLLLPRIMQKLALMPALGTAA